MFSGTFPSFSGLQDPEKGGENGQLRGFPILRIFGRDVKTRKTTVSHPSFSVEGWGSSLFELFHILCRSEQGLPE